MAEKYFGVTRPSYVTICWTHKTISVKYQAVVLDSEGKIEIRIGIW